jgi:hypothetical protein
MDSNGVGLDTFKISVVLSLSAFISDPLLHGNGPPLFGYAGIGSGSSIAKPIPRPAAAMFNPHLHTLLACRHPYLTGEHTGYRIRGIC